MKQDFEYLKVRRLVVLFGGLLATSPALPQQLPTGMQVVNGAASLQQSGAQLTVTNSNNAILNWNNFSIGAGNSVHFAQPGASSQVLNRVVGNDPSNILGNLSSNGRVWLLNPNGVLFGANARVDVAGLVASTLNLSSSDWLAGHYRFTAGAPGAGIDNQGELRTTLGGQVALIGESVSNEGIIEAAGGQITLAAGQSVELVDTGAPNLSVKVAAPSGSALNLGSLRAGRIDVIAAAVNQQGLVQAENLSAGPAGEIVLQAGNRLTLAGGSATRADGAVGGAIKLLGNEIDLQNGSAVSASGGAGGGSILVGGGAEGKDASIPNANAVYVAPQASLNADALNRGNGGHIVVWSDVATRAFGRFSARGGSAGGNGGLIETSGHWLDARPAALDVSAPEGKSGTWLLDPYDITIDDSVPDTNVDPSFTATGDPAHISSGTIIDALIGGANVTISTGTGGNQAGNITITGASISDFMVPRAETLSFLAAGDIKVTDSIIDPRFSFGCEVDCPPILPLSVVMRAGGGGAGAISIDTSQIYTYGGGITLGGFGPSGAAIGHGSGEFANGVYVASSTLYASAGTISIVGTTAAQGGSGVVLGPAGQENILVSGDLFVVGQSTNASSPGPGVDIHSGSIDVSNTLSISGSGTGIGLNIVSDGSLTVLNSGTDGSFTLSGTSSGGNYGVLIDNTAANVDTYAPLQSYGGGLTINGTNGAGSPLEAVYIQGSPDSNLFGPGFTNFSGGPNSSGFFDIKAVGGGATLRDVATQDPYISSVTVSSSSSLLIDNSHLGAIGTIELQAQQVSLANDTVLAPDQTGGVGPANPSDPFATVLTVSGPGGTGPAQSFDNKAGAGAFLLPSTPDYPARWIIWLNDATVPANLNLGGLAYDFQRYGAKSPAAWAGDSYNGVVSYVSKTVTLGGSVASRTYDGTTTASVGGLSLTPQVSGDQLDPYCDCFFGSYDGSFADKNAGSGKTVLLSGFSPQALRFIDSSSHPVYGYTFVNALKGDIARAVLQATVTGTNKIYDGNTNATVNITNVTGLVGNETVASTGTGSFFDRNVGQNKPINVSFALGNGTNGGLGSNYVLQPNGPVTANITPAPLNFTGVGVNRVYDGTTNAMAAVTGITGLVGGDAVTITGSGVFADKNVGQAKSFTATYAFDGGSSGWLASNYQFRTSDVLTADVTPAPLSVIATGVNRVYDGTTNATVNVSGISGLVGSETVTVTGAGSFADKNAGQAKPINVSYTFGAGGNGFLASNYSVPGSGQVTADITPATLTYSANPSNLFVGAALTGFSGSVGGFIAGETLASATTGTLAFAAGVADSSVAGVYAINGQGLSATNYSFVQALGNAVALTIDALPINPPDGPLVQAQISALPARNVGPAPAPRPDPRTSGLLDLTPRPPSAPPQGVGPPAIASFDSVPIDAMTPLALADLLSARESLMDRVLKEGLDKLRRDPTLADVSPCKSLKEALAGTCLVTEAMKAEYSAARLQTGAPAPATATPQPDAAKPVSAAPELPPPLFASARVKNAALPEIRRKVAVLIGEGHYADSKIPGLANTVGDSHAVASTLTEQLGYETLVLDNPSKEALIATLNRLALEVGPQDSAVVFYAGHGAVVEETGAGYWLASSSQAEDPKTWLSNADIARLIEQVGAKQVVLISDSCYSGSLVGGARIRGTPGELNPSDVLARRSAVVMSSGGNEPVFDSGRDGHSLFAWSLMNTLSQVKSWRPGGNLFERIRFTVARELPQRPQYGAAPGYQEGGDYLFEVRELDTQSSGEKAPG